jgi:(1->4)-alpha-D-glucan 1-alpha-D-glucosylmutase
MPAQYPLRATYRLQLHKEFTLHDARRIVPYLSRLGISHIYTSPVLTARPGSSHGYDVVDPTRVNPEIGGEDAFRALVAELRAHEMGLVLDIVPNHMGTGSSNPYWEDLLTHGRESRYARWFDVDWDVPDPALHDRVLLPVLGDELDAVLDRRELAIVRDDERGTLRFKYGDHSFPLDDGSIAVLEGRELNAPTDAGGRARFRQILGRQHYSLVSWRQAARRINYRRFFDVTDLVALRMEDPAVFAETHDRILGWIADGSIDGLRVDHIDGLLDPRGYLERLRAAVAARRGADSEFPIFVEKILSQGEQLRRDWPVEGSTGYEVLNQLENVFIDAEGFDGIEERYRRMLRSSGKPLTFEQVALQGKRDVLRGALSSDVARLTRLLEPLARLRHHAAPIAGGGPNDLGLPAQELDSEALTTAIVEVIAHLPVYRTYLDGGDGVVAPEDADVLVRAFAGARAGGDASPDALDLLAEILLSAEAAADDGERDTRRLFVRRFQQTSGPATAKGVEDTALYIYMPLVSRNEVGGSPERPLADSVHALHAANRQRQQQWPAHLVCTTTHDTKRSADLRARLDVLSEMPEPWWREARRWRTMNRGYRGTVGRRASPDPNTEYLLYQVLLGVWPLNNRSDELPDPEVIRELHERLEAYLLKAAKEGKSRSSWTDPDERFETGMREFLATVLFRSPDFLADVAQFTERIARPGLWNSLSRMLMHLTVPGTPDIYQGDELWNFALVDPDNRRPVDYEARSRLLASMREGGACSSDEQLAEMMGLPEDGRIKMHLLASTLEARRAHRQLFAAGEYVPLDVVGRGSGHLIAFARTHGDEAVIIGAPRLSASLVDGRDAPVGERAWGDTRIVLPPALRDRAWKSVLANHEIAVDEARAELRVATLMPVLPVALVVTA